MHTVRKCSEMALFVYVLDYKAVSTSGSFIALADRLAFDFCSPLLLCLPSFYIFALVLIGDFSLVAELVSCLACCLSFAVFSNGAFVCVSCVIRLIWFLWHISLLGFADFLRFTLVEDWPFLY